MRTVYVITNTVSGQQYVGETGRTLTVRWRHHCWPSTPTALSCAINEYGSDAFTIEALETCADEEALPRELYWAQSLGTLHPRGYNMRAGDHAVPALRQKISASSKGRVASDDTKAKLSTSHTGLVVSDTTKAKLSRINRGKPLSELARKNSVATCSKTYSMVSPEGELVTFTNMAEFCRNNNLSRSKLCSVAAGKLDSHKGWRQS